MGRDNVDALLLLGAPPELPARTYECLLHMARLAKDEHGRYWNGHTWLVLVMGYDQTPRGSGYRNVRKHIQLLTKHGYISVLTEEGGRRTTYQLHIKGRPFPVDN